MIASQDEQVMRPYTSIDVSGGVAIFAIKIYFGGKGTNYLSTLVAGNQLKVEASGVQAIHPCTR